MGTIQTPSGKLAQAGLRGHVREWGCRGSSLQHCLNALTRTTCTENTSNTGVQYPATPLPHFALPGDVQCHCTGIVSGPELPTSQCVSPRYWATLKGSHSLPCQGRPWDSSLRWWTQSNSQSLHWKSGSYPGATWDHSLFSSKKNCCKTNTSLKTIEVGHMRQCFGECLTLSHQQQALPCSFLFFFSLSPISPLLPLLKVREKGTLWRGNISSKICILLWQLEESMLTWPMTADSGLHWQNSIRRAKLW